MDFEFKEPDVMDHKAIEKWLWEDRDFLELLDSVDSEFKGHSIDSSTGYPVFAFRVGQNEMSQSVSLTDEGRIEFIFGKFLGVLPGPPGRSWRWWRPPRRRPAPRALQSPHTPAPRRRWGGRRGRTAR